MAEDEQGVATKTRDPEISAEVREDGTGEISVDGVVERVERESLQEAGAAITSRIAELAEGLGHPVPVQVRDPEGVWSLLIHPDGSVDEAPKDGAPDEPAPAPAATAPETTPETTPEAARPDPLAATSPPSGLIAASAPARDRSSTTLPTLDDLLAARHPVTPGPAERGVRVGIRRVTFGAVSPGPGRKEQRRRVQQAAVRRGFDGPKTIVVINPKGGAHKTTATMMLAATFGLERGGYTLAWDNNETRGTLGWRSAHTEHARTAVDLLHALPTLGDEGTVRVGDLDAFVRTQSTQQFDVLASDEDSASAASVDAASFTALHDVLSRFYRVLVVDTGNNMRASNWQAAVKAADQIVVVSTIREDTAQSAAWALDALRSTGHEDAVRRAVTVLSEPDRKVDKDLRRRLRSHFGALTRAIVEVPHDAALVAGGPIDFESLRPDTRDAWLRATAVVADGL
ncbi:chromosome partitioning protein [Cellulomonas sp. PhB150]|uniref:MinD/ParA family ATP-binding protein n=1 Tax=Cellulomonas sp. PhB150 TaxID=2485188 RepID=UPI000F49E572|nr:chromosome partitioning protein [Cellulomonas sp. PhB150]ROS25937.1 MinD-like ATPase involved in chromosome partitioning or flagellar assembly [Cellulomonas sp. PhB150]